MPGHPEALAPRRSAIAEIGLLMDVRLIEVDQPMSILLGTGQQILHLREERLPPFASAAGCASVGSGTREHDEEEEGGAD